MTSSYIVLSGPNGAAKTETDLRFVRDGFSLLAFLFPGFWLLAHRLWIPALAAFIVQALGWRLTNDPSLWPLGAALALGTMLLAGLEGRHLQIRRLLSQGWRHAGLTVARSRAMAEEMYFAGIVETAHRNVPTPTNSPTGRPAGGPISAPLGLLGFGGGR